MSDSPSKNVEQQEEMLLYETSEDQNAAVLEELNFRMSRMRLRNELYLANHEMIHNADIAADENNENEEYVQEFLQLDPMVLGNVNMIRRRRNMMISQEGQDEEEFQLQELNILKIEVAAIIAHLKMLWDAQLSELRAIKGNNSEEYDVNIPLYRQLCIESQKYDMICWLINQMLEARRSRGSVAGTSR